MSYGSSETGAKSEAIAPDTVLKAAVKTICTLVRTANRGIATGHQAQKCLPMAPVALLIPA